MKKTKKKITGAFWIMVIAAVLILAGYYVLTHKEIKLGRDEVSQPSTDVDKLIAKDLELKYPSTPTEVVKLYWKLNQCMYNNSLKEKDFEALLKQLRMLYDEEFLEAQGNDWDTMLTNFKNDKKTFSKEKRLISSYSVDIDSTVDYATVKGRECATLNSSTFETVKSKSTRTYAKFMCRKDNNGKWKILGWEKTDASESEE